MYRLAQIALAGGLALFAVVSTGSARAEPLNAATGTVLLTISGEIGETNAEGAAQFDLDMLRALGETEVNTETIWTAGEQRFVGVALDRLMTRVGATGSHLTATAINDYSVEIPLGDVTDGVPIIAYEMDGKPMSRRDKGPLWVIYPYSSDPAFRTEVIYSRSIWQLDRLVVMK